MHKLPVGLQKMISYCEKSFSGWIISSHALGGLKSFV